MAKIPHYDRIFGLVWGRWAVTVNFEEWGLPLRYAHGTRASTVAFLCFELSYWWTRELEPWS